MAPGCGTAASGSKTGRLWSHRLRLSMQQPELRLVRYWIAVAEEANITRAAVLLERGRELLALADAVVEEVRARDVAAVGRLRIGMTPTARYEVGPALLTACADRVPGVMLYPREDTTGALLRDLRAGALDLAVLFCAPPADGIAMAVLRDEPAVVHVR